MRVLLKRDFFYAGMRYRLDPNGTVFPDDAEKHLPKDAEIIVEEKAAPKTRKRKQTSDERHQGNLEI